MLKGELILYPNASFDEFSKESSEAIFQLLLSPISSYSTNLLILLRFPSSVSVTRAESGFLGGHYSELLFSQHYLIRRQVSQEIAKTALKSSLSSEFKIDSLNGVDLIFGELCDAIIRDQKDGDLFACKDFDAENEMNSNVRLEWEDIIEEQSLVSRLIQLVKSSDGDANLEFKVIYIVCSSLVNFSCSSTFRSGWGS